MDLPLRGGKRLGPEECHSAMQEEERDGSNNMGKRKKNGGGEHPARDSNRDSTHLCSLRGTLGSSGINFWWGTNLLGVP